MNDKTRHLIRLFAFSLLLGLQALILHPALAGDACPDKPVELPVEVGQLPNLGKLKLAIINYGCFGQYKTDVAKVMNDAQTYLGTRMNVVPKPAIVLDIDETSLSNWQQYLANDFGYIGKGDCRIPDGPCASEGWDKSQRAVAFDSTLALFNFAKANHVGIFFVTGRSETPDERQSTTDNLQGAGYVGFNHLYMRVSGFGSVTEYKTAQRKEIERLGYTIVANVGDQDSDLAGGEAERTFKVPNPMYFIP